MTRARHALESERAAFCETLRRVGRDAPTLVDGWRAFDIAAHVAAQEVAGGVPLVAGYAVVLPMLAVGVRVPSREEVMTGRVRRHTFDGLISRLAAGPPAVVRGAGISAVRMWENFVHHEDIRRAHPGWEPRRLSVDADALLWASLWWMARYQRRAFDGLALELRSTTGRCRMVFRGATRAVVSGPTSELALFLAGRARVASVEFAGDAVAVEIFARTSLSV